MTPLALFMNLEREELTGLGIFLEENLKSISNLYVLLNTNENTYRPT